MCQCDTDERARAGDCAIGLAAGSRRKRQRRHALRSRFAVPQRVQCQVRRAMHASHLHRGLATQTELTEDPRSRLGIVRVIVLG